MMSRCQIKGAVQSHVKHLNVSTRLNKRRKVISLVSWKREPLLPETMWKTCVSETGCWPREVDAETGTCASTLKWLRVKLRQGKIIWGRAARGEGVWPFTALQKQERTLKLHQICSSGHLEQDLGDKFLDCGRSWWGVLKFVEIRKKLLYIRLT